MSDIAEEKPNSENPEEFTGLKLSDPKTIAAGIPAVMSSAKHIFSEMGIGRALKALSALNQKLTLALRQRVDPSLPYPSPKLQPLFPPMPLHFLSDDLLQRLAKELILRAWRQVRVQKHAGTVRAQLVDDVAHEQAA